MGFPPLEEIYLGPLEGKHCYAAVPLLKGGLAVGVLFFRSDERRAFDDQVVNLLERMAKNVIFALENFEHETERKRTEERIQYMATHDALTGLPNRMLFGQLLNHAIQSARRFRRQLAVFSSTWIDSR